MLWNITEMEMEIEQSINWKSKITSSQTLHIDMQGLSFESSEKWVKQSKHIPAKPVPIDDKLTREMFH